MCAMPRGAVLILRGAAARVLEVVLVVTLFVWLFIAAPVLVAALLYLLTAATLLWFGVALRDIVRGTYEL